MASRADIKAALLLSRGNVVEAAGRCASKFEPDFGERSNDDEISFQGTNSDQKILIKKKTHVATWS
jgi:hypothetical protein